MSIGSEQDSADQASAPNPNWAIELLSQDSDKPDTEHVEYWFRRFFTSLVIGNAAGAFALGAFITGSEDRASAAKLVLGEFTWYLIGAAAAGIVPFAMWLRLVIKKKRPRIEQKDPESRPVAIGYEHPVFWALLFLIFRYLAFPIAAISAGIFVWSGFQVVGDLQVLSDQVLE